MAKFKEREKALKLRKKGYSYSQIKRELNVSKGTLSLWLRDYPLPKSRIRELRDQNEGRIEKFRKTMAAKRQARLQRVYNEQKKKIFPLRQRELFLAGLFLYWGEGLKRGDAQVAVSNTDPTMINFFVKWIVNNFGITRAKLRVRLHLYDDMDLGEEMDYWSNVLNLPIEQFAKPRVKKTSSNRINYKGGYGHGTCDIIIGDVRLQEKILMGIRVIQDKYMRQ